MSNDTYSGQTLEGKYRLTDLLGRGGMGAVYRGEHVVIGKKVAVKFLHAEFAGNEEVVKRFYREAQAAAAIGHDGIIDVMDVGISPRGDPFIVMEFLEGESLADMLDRTGPIDLGAACGVLEPALLALHAAHSKGIVHRDLKPENIFLAHRQNAPPKVKLIDFGISKFAQAGSGEKLTQTGSVMGTPAYMSPEQARGSADLDHRADIYSMGVMMYEMLTGKLPFEGDNFTEMIISILTDPPRPPREVFDRFPHEAEAVLLKALAKDPAERHQTAAELVEDLRELGEYGERESRLTHLAAEAKHTTFAAGNLGVTNDSKSGFGEPVAAEVLAQVSGGGTPTGWAGTRAGASRRSGKRALWIVGSLAAALSLVGVVAAVLLWGENEPEPVQVPLSSGEPGQAAAEEEGSTVSIEVTGAPQGARLFYDDMLVTVNPFKVERDDVATPLRIEAEGYEPLLISVTPDVDKTVAIPPLKSVEQEKKAEADDEGEKKAKRGKRRRGKRAAVSEPKPAPAAASSTPAPPPPKKKKGLEQGTRGTKMSTEFE
ncbi:MAG: serine/threonine-protein kinase [Polyangia bacterium]